MPADEGTQRFDQAAATWDQEARRVALADAVAAAIAAQVPLSPHWEALDFGCGTGLVTLALASRLGAITGADASTGMLEVLDGKAAVLGLPLRTRLLDPEAPDLGGPYDLILSSMTLHHVQDVPALFRAFAAHLRPGGSLALADLDEEPGTFHDGHGDVFHLGFRREAIREWLEAAGFMEVRVETAAVTRKADREYPIFLATARLRNPPT